jgi:hypothetical protein
MHPTSMVIESSSRRPRPAKPTAFTGAVGLTVSFQDPLGTKNGRAVDQAALAARATTQARASDEVAVTSVSAGTGRAAG